MNSSLILSEQAKKFKVGFGTCDHCGRGIMHNAVIRDSQIGDRCELLHEVHLFNIDIRMGDVMPIAEVVAAIEKTALKPAT